VHVPDEGSIAGTDVAIPFDEVRVRSAELPQDRDAPVAVYCKSGRMSAEAVATLRQLG
jgi:rhodanese-related sulfurtransferase